MTRNCDNSVTGPHRPLIGCPRIGNLTRVKDRGKSGRSVAWRVCAAVFACALCACTNTNNEPAPGFSRQQAFDAGTPAPVSKKSGYLWFAGAELNAFTHEQTNVSTDGGPAVIVTPSALTSTFHDLVFDPDGNLWTIPITGDQIIRLGRTGLGGDARPIPDLTIKSPSLQSPITLTFDKLGNLWVVNYNGGGPSIANIVRFDAVRGSAGGTQTLTPSLFISPGTDKMMADRFSQGSALAFDAAGNLWFGGISSLMRFENVSSLSGMVMAAPAAIVSTGDSFASIAFDGVGSLWVSAARAGYFALRIDRPNMLTGTVAYTADARVKLPATTSTFAGGMAFDSLGALWISMSDQIVELSNPSSMYGNVSPGAAVVLKLPSQSFPDLVSKLAFWPIPPGLPL